MEHSDDLPAWMKTMLDYGSPGGDLDGEEREGKRLLRMGRGRLSMGGEGELG